MQKHGALWLLTQLKTRYYFLSLNLQSIADGVAEVRLLDLTLSKPALSVVEGGEGQG